jgi:hypothetical protein
VTLFQEKSFRRDIPFFIKDSLNNQINQFIKKFKGVEMSKISQGEFLKSK